MNDVQDQNSAQALELSELPTGAQPGPLLDNNLQVIQNVRVDLVVHVGNASISVGELMRLQASSVLTLDRTVETPVDVILEGQVIARGQLVAVGEQFGVCITEVPKRETA